MFTFRDITFCSDKKCLRYVCPRHMENLKENTEDLPYSVGDFIDCDSRIHLKGDEYEEPV